jgi:hypothetical protein
MAKGKHAAEYAECLAGLSAESLRPINLKFSKQIADALEKGSAALPSDRLREVVALLFSSGRPHPMYDAFARGPLPELAAAAAPLLAAKRDENDFAAAFFLAALEAGALEDAARLRRVLDRTSNMPGVAKQAPQVETSPAVLEVARNVLGEYAPTEEGLCEPFQLVYGLVGLLAKEGSKPSIDAIEAFTVRATLKDKTAEQQTLRMLNAVGRGELATSFAERIAKREGARNAATESQRLAEAIGLPMRGDPNWSASIWIAEGEPTEWFGDLQNSLQVNLRLWPAWSDWTVIVRGPRGKGLYTCHSGEHLQNDLGVPRLSQLAAFPRWLVDAGAKLGVKFSTADAKINCGRQRSGAELFRSWLASGLASRPGE